MRDGGTGEDRMDAMIAAIDRHLAALEPAESAAPTPADARAEPGVAAVIAHARRCIAESRADLVPRSGAAETRAGATGGSDDNPASRRYLAPALEAARLGPAAALVDAIAAVKAELAWFYGYPSRPGEEDLPERVAFAQILGPKVRHRSDRTRLGFTLLGPRTHYPVHAHPAVELYYVLAGTARWMTPAANALRPPGAFILHGSGEPHAMETGDEPLLAFYAWSGDIDSPSVYTPEARLAPGSRPR